jgi:hypothetical protein
LSGFSFRVIQPRAEIVSRTIGLGWMIGETSDSWGRDIAGWLNSSGLDQLAIYVVAHQKIPRLMQHSTLTFKIMESVRALRNLEVLAVLVDGVVFSYDPLALHIRDIARFAGMNGSPVRSSAP